MSFGWSAGDVASAMKLLYRVGKALKESCDASSDFAETSSFLLALQTTLRLLQSLDAVAINSEFAESFKTICRQIQLPLDVFLKDVLKYEPALASAGKHSKLLTAPRKIQWALVMPSKINKLQSQIGGAMLAVNMLMGHQALDLASRLHTTMPSMLKDHFTAALERNLATHLIDSVVQPLECALLACKEELVTMNKRSQMDIAQRNEELDETISNALRSSNEQYLESLSDLLQALQAMNLKIDQSNDSNRSREVMDGNPLSALLSVYEMEIDRFRTTSQSVSLHAAQLDVTIEPGEPINQDDELVIALRRTRLQLKIWSVNRFLRLVCPGCVKSLTDTSVWLFISKMQKLTQDLLLALMPFFAMLYQQLRESTRRILLPMIGDRFSFEDALGRTQLLSCTDLQSWKIFCAYLEISFKGLPGFNNVVRNRFEIMNAYNGAVIDETMWAAIIQPRTKLAMAMVLARPATKEGDCPVLDSAGNVVLNDKQPSVICPACNKYLRIASSDAGLYKDDFKDSLNPMNVVRPSTEGLKRKQDRKLHEISSLRSANTEADISSFKRIACAPKIAFKGKSSPNAVKKEEYVYYWIWTCCSCSGQGGMTTEIVNCPDSYCQHLRCGSCPFKEVKMRKHSAVKQRKRHGFSIRGDR